MLVKSIIIPAGTVTEVPGYAFPWYHNREITYLKKLRGIARNGEITVHNQFCDGQVTTVKFGDGRIKQYPTSWLEIA